MGNYYRPHPNTQAILDEIVAIFDNVDERDEWDMSWFRSEVSQILTARDKTVPDDVFAILYNDGRYELRNTAQEGEDKHHLSCRCEDCYPLENLIGRSWRKETILSKFIDVITDYDEIDEGTQALIVKEMDDFFFLTAREGECRWERDAREGEDTCLFVTSCKQEFWLNDGTTPFQTGMEYCCFCGRTISKLPAPPKEGE